MPDDGRGTRLLDGNVLVALVVAEHVHHAAARAWFARGGRFATCPTVQGTLLRLLVRQGLGSDAARQALSVITRHARHEQWLDDLTYLEVDLSGVVGHRQVTDAYLAGLARARRGRVATLDRGFAVAASDVAELVPTD
ncbi:MAG: PIN domain-containing protein [Actinobacteria bacterium]|nr:PIN domain-containing protein [Actinomycetota bacterium]